MHLHLGAPRQTYKSLDAAADPRKKPKNLNIQFVLLRTISVSMEQLSMRLFNGAWNNFHSVTETTLTRPGIFFSMVKDRWGSRFRRTVAEQSRWC